MKAALDTDPNQGILLYSCPFCPLCLKQLVHCTSPDCLLVTCHSGLAQGFPPRKPSRMSPSAVPSPHSLLLPAALAADYCPHILLGHHTTSPGQGWWPPMCPSAWHRPAARCQVTQWIDTALTPLVFSFISSSGLCGFIVLFLYMYMGSLRGSAIFCSECQHLPEIANT